MKKRNLLLLPLFALLLAGCRQPDVSQDPVSSEPPVSVTSETPTTSEDPTSVPVSDDDSIPEPPTSEAPVYPKRTIEELRAMTGEGEDASEAQKEQKYETSGIVTAKFRGANIKNVGPAWNIAIQDGEHALLLYAITEADYAAHFAAVPVGSKLTVTGHLAAYGGLRELDRIGYVSHEEATAVVPEVLTDVKKEALVGKDSKLVKIEGLKLHSKPTLVAEMGENNRTNIKLEMDIRKDGDPIGTYMHYNIPLEDAQETIELLKTVTSNSTITWTGVIGMNRGDYQLTNAHKDEWEITVGDPVVLGGLAFAEAAVEVALGSTYQAVLLPEPFDGPLDGLAYASADEAIATISAEGLVTPVAEGTTNVTATVGSIVATMSVKVLAEGPLTEVTVPLVNLLDGKALEDVVEVANAEILWHMPAGKTLVIATEAGHMQVNYYYPTAGDEVAQFAPLVKGDHISLTVKVSTTTGGDFARSKFGIPQNVDGFFVKKLAAKVFKVVGMADSAPVDLSAGLNWLKDYTIDDMGKYIRVVGKVVGTSGDQIYLQYSAAVAGENTFDNGTNYIRISAYKATTLGFTLEANKTYLVGGIIGGVNQNLPLTGTNNPIFRVYVQELIEQ